MPTILPQNMRVVERDTPLGLRNNPPHLLRRNCSRLSSRALTRDLAEDLARPKLVWTILIRLRDPSPSKVFGVWDDARSRSEATAIRRRMLPEAKSREAGSDDTAAYVFNTAKKGAEHHALRL